MSLCSLSRQRYSDPNLNDITTKKHVGASSTIRKSPGVPTNIEKHYRALGYKLTSSLQISELKTVNAFAQDQRTVVITRALLARTHDTSEIAFVIAHEIAHIALNHDKNAGVHEELEADALALKVVTTMGFNPCSGSSVLERLGSRTKFILVSVSPRLTALHNKTFSICG